MKILLIDDDKQDIELSLMALSEIDLDTSVRVAYDGLEALESLYKHDQDGKTASSAPQLIILDLKMPKLDGFKILSALKNDNKLKFIPVIVFTSSGEEQDISESYRLGVNAYVIKPIQFEKFFDTVKHIGRFWMMLNVAPAIPK